MPIWHVRTKIVYVRVTLRLGTRGFSAKSVWIWTVRSRTNFLLNEASFNSAIRNFRTIVIVDANYYQTRDLLVPLSNIFFCKNIIIFSNNTSVLLGDWTLEQNQFLFQSLRFLRISFVIVFLNVRFAYYKVAWGNTTLLQIVYKLRSPTSYNRSSTKKSVCTKTTTITSYYMSAGSTFYLDVNVKSNDFDVKHCT